MIKAQHMVGMMQPSKYATKQHEPHPHPFGRETFRTFCRMLNPPLQTQTIVV